MTPIRSDARYTVTLEHCGREKPRHVARFCGEWIGQSISQASAIMHCIGHDARRKGAIVIEEKTA